MADQHIDEREVSEYGEYCYAEIKKLDGLSVVVNIESLRGLLREAIDGFQRERGAITDSLETSRRDTKTSAQEGRDVLSRFFSFLGSLKTGTIDKGAFFKREKLGDLQKLKPADVLTKLETVALGFQAKENQSFKDREEWSNELALAISNLKLSLDTKESKRTDATRSVEKKAAAYNRFILVYNQIAKPAVSALLAEQSRAGEYELFFKDLQVKESTSDKKTQSEAAKRASETKKNKTPDPA